MAVRHLGRLRAPQINKLPPGRYADGGGLYLNVSPAGTRSWIFRYRTGGRLRDHGLGPTHTISLVMARQKALDCRRARYSGIDPIDEKRAGRTAARLTAARAMSFGQCAEELVATHRAGWRNAKSEQQWRQSLADYAFPVLGDLPVAAIDTTLVMKVLEPLWAVKTETASRLRGRIEAILNWAKTRGYRQGENPARWKGHLENLLPKKSKVKSVEHHAALPYPEIGGFVTALRQQPGIDAQALEFAILTAARTAEVIGMRWDELGDLAERVWTVPAVRMKGHREHRVPLSDAALAVLTAMAKVRVGAFVFPGAQLNRPVSPGALQQVLERMKWDDVTVHGFRSTFRDWAADRTSFPSDIVEMALAHQVGSEVERAYRRSDLMAKRRQLMEAWAVYCSAVSPGEGEVVPLHRAAG